MAGCCAGCCAGFCPECGGVLEQPLINKLGDIRQQIQSWPVMSTVSRQGLAVEKGNQTDVVGNR